MSHEWKFKNKKFMDLENLLLPSDCENFNFRIKGVDIEDYFKNAAIGAKKFLLKEKLELMPNARRHVTM